MSLLLDALKKAAEKKARTEADRTEVEPTELDSIEPTEANLPQDDARSRATTGLSDPADLEATETIATQRIEETHFDETEMPTTKIDPTIAGDEEPTITSEDSEMVFMDDGDDNIEYKDSHSGAELGPSGSEPPHEDIEATVVLTPDDVTEFLGDGLSAQDSNDHPYDIPSQPSNLGSGADERSEDTITNSEGLELTTFNEEDESLQLQRDSDSTRSSMQDQTSTETASIPTYQKERLALQDPDDEQETVIDPQARFADQSGYADGDGTAGTVDIERLTNDETITVRESEPSMTFAPDNYDRTLMKISDSDVSRIFPGMKAESDVVMTPEYAKKVFRSKSSGVKLHHYKIYSVLGLVVLLAVLLLGMFSVSDEMDMIDSSLVSMKRDPMPGLLKPKQTETAQDLFSAPEPTQIDERVIDVIASAEGEIIPPSAAADDSSLMTSDSSTSQVQVVPERVSNQVEPQNVTSVQPVASTSEETAAFRESDSATAAVEPQPVVERVAVTDLEPRRQNIAISSSSRIAQKDAWLAKAYEAYESGDIKTARTNYDRVLDVDAENRNALLGRAAVHVLDNQFNKAISLYQQILISNPKDDAAMTSLISVADIDPGAGETEVKRLLNEHPESPYLYFVLGNMYGNQQRWVEAQTSYFNALTLKPDDPNYAYNLAVSLEHLQKSHSAITYYRRALENRENGLSTFNSDVVAQRIEVLDR